jgi:hypothetical protein
MLTVLYMLYHKGIFIRIGEAISFWLLIESEHFEEETSKSPNVTFRPVFVAVFSY